MGLRFSDCCVDIALYHIVSVWILGQDDSHRWAESRNPTLITFSFHGPASDRLQHVALPMASGSTLSPPTFRCY